MKKNKNEFTEFFGFDYTELFAVAEYLQLQEERGFRLKEFRSHFWVFEKSEPKKIRYTAVLFRAKGTMSRKEFVEKYPNAVAAFLEEYKKSVEFTNENVEEASALIEKAGIISAAVAKSAIPNSHIVFIDSDEMKQSMSGFLKVLFDMQPNSIGGAIPGDDFYYGA